MTVRMLGQIVGPRSCFEAGEIYDVPTDQGKAWVENGHAEPVMRRRVDSPEQTTRTPRETRKR